MKLKARKIEVAFDHPANSDVLHRLKAAAPLRFRGPSASLSPSEVDAYWGLGTHPDLVRYLWSDLGHALPAKCEWIVFGYIALVRPDSGIIFGVAFGTHAYAFRLPYQDQARFEYEALEQAKQNAMKFGLAGKERECYLHAHTGPLHIYTNGCVSDVRDFGADWVFGRFLPGDTEWCRTAYEYAK